MTLTFDAITRVIKRSILSNLVSDDLAVAFCAPKDAVGLNILASGQFEADAIAVLKSIAHGDVMLDVGANIGTHTVALAPNFKRVIAFEPNIALTHVVRANAAAAGLSNVEVVPAGLSDANKSASLFYPPNHMSWGALSGGPGTIEIKIDLRRGDDVVASMLASGERVSFIKIDVEGHESEALEGLQSTLRRDHPIVAYEAIDANKNPRCMSLLSSFGYTRFRAFPPRTVSRLLWGREAELQPATPDTISHCIIADAPPQSSPR